LEKIAGSGIADSFYLAGGTALALQLGHRISIDLDWFTADSFSLEAVKKKISVLGEFKLSGEEEWTLHGALDGVKVSFLRYDYSLLYPLIGWEGIKLADERDIAAMKIDAASSRGSKKDFIDIYYLLLKYRLPELIGFFEKKFQNIKYNKLHILKSLVFFEDAEDEPMPIMIKKTDWEAVKKKIAAEANKILEA
jgi:predicted nucleotidyltransferase component of viral defense system